MPVTFKDYYDTLGVPRTADSQDIQRAFRKRARESHPDLNRDNADAEETFKNVNEAYEVLSDPEKRRMYDRFGDDWSRYRDAGVSPNDMRAGRGAASAEDFGHWFAGNGGTTFTSTESNGRFSDFFTLLFGNEGGIPGRSRRSGPTRGQDHELATTITLEEAARGTRRQVTLHVPKPCPTCNGTGVARSAPCPTCDATGTVRQLRNIEVTIPAGVRTGSRVRVAGQGSPGANGGPNGDVYLVISIVPHPRFERSADDLATTVDVPVDIAVLGGEVIVPTLNGRVALAIPEGTQTGRTFRLRGKGMPVLRQSGKAGDLRVTVQVRVPTDLTAEERGLFERLRSLRESNAPTT